jgi:PAS domain S-box-containing protein
MSSGGPPPLESAAIGLSGPEEHATVLAAAVASALDAIVVVDEAGAVVALNPAAVATFGYAPAEALGRNISELIVPPHMRAAHEHGMSRYHDTREPRVLGRRVEMEALCRDGRVIPVELAITEVLLPGRRLFTASLRDLSAAREAAAEIARQREALHQSEKLAAIGSLLAGVAHELNNPLSIVLGQATLLAEELAESGGGAAPAAARAAKIEAAAQRCVRVVRSFLAIARQRKAEIRKVAVRPLLDSALDLLAYNLNSNGIAVLRGYDDGTPDVMADHDQVQNIVTNLIVNAAQALESIDRPREIRVTAREIGAERLAIRIADNGPGIPAEMARRIFEPFFTTKPQGVGTGIGLSISRGLAESQGGSLMLVESPLGGAAFELVLPLAISAVSAASVVERELPATPNASARRAVVVDDEPEIALLLADAMRRAGFACAIAIGGREGQALIAADPAGWDAVVCDLRMPDLDGPALYRWIAATYPPLAHRVLFVTGDALGPVAGRFLAESGRPVLEKPFTASELARLVAQFPPRPQ